jgi:hypothetical protein
VEATYRKSAEAWGAAYKERERSATMGKAMHLANHVFEAVGIAADPGAGLASQRAILAAAIAEFQEQARAELRAEYIAEARAIVAGAVLVAHKELDRVAADVLSGKHFVP